MTNWHYINDFLRQKKTLRLMNFNFWSMILSADRVSLHSNIDWVTKLLSGISGFSHLDPVNEANCHAGLQLVYLRIVSKYIYIWKKFKLTHQKALCLLLVWPLYERSWIFWGTMIVWMIDGSTREIVQPNYLKLPNDCQCPDWKTF